ncbi:unnamed protein product [Schistosoma turkestanicum]|nr:unnamed protein product [Schistosoma turkestanicum]
MCRKLRIRRVIKKLENIVFDDYKDIIYQESDHYYYTLRVSRMYRCPVTFIEPHKRTKKNYLFKPIFPILYYGMNYTTITAQTNGKEINSDQF